MRMTEKQIIQRLQGATEQYAPLIMKRLDEQVYLSEGYRADAIVEFSVQDGPTFEAVVEITPVATPKNVLGKSRILIEYINEDSNSERIPMIVAPYMGARQARILSERGISWIDLSGNMSIRILNQVYIERTGKLNRFPDTAPIKKIFQGTSALVSRALLLKPRGFKSVNEIYKFINSRNANITLSTVSKVLKSLDEELLISKKDSFITVIDQEKLLERLTDSYIKGIKRREKNIYTFSLPQPRCAFMGRNVIKSNYLVCGFYAARLKGLAASDEITIFTKDMNKAREEFDFLEPDSEFWNFKFIETDNGEMWFNSVDINLTMASVINVSVPIVDEIELYLEMMALSPRGPKIAEQLKQRILQKAGGNGQKDN